MDDGDIAYTIVTTLASGDPNYNNDRAADVSVTNLDDDTSGVVVNPTALNVSEPAGTADFLLALAAAPAAPVTILADAEQRRVCRSGGATLDAGNWQTGVP